MFKRFIIYGFLGWGIEIFWTGLNSLIEGNVRLIGFTNLWMFLIYGFAVFLEPIHNRIFKWNWIVRGLVWLILIWTIEYSTGFVLRGILSVSPWTYNGALAVDGLIRLDFAPLWFIAGFIFEYMHRLLDKYQVY